MEAFTVHHADGGATTISPMNRETWAVTREGGPRAHGRSTIKAAEITSSLRADELTRFGEWLTRLANPDIPQTQAIAAGFGVKLMQREYEDARGIADDLRSLAHYAELADATLEVVTDALNARDQAASDDAEVSGGPLTRRIVDVLRGCTGTLSAQGIADALHVDVDEITVALPKVAGAGIVFTDHAEAPLRYGIAEGWR